MRRSDAMPMVESDPLRLVARIADDAWEELRKRPFVQKQLGVLPSRLPDVSLAEAERRSEVGRSLLSRLPRLDEGSLPHEWALTLRVVRFYARTWARERDWYWTVVDPLGVGIFGLFLPTAYCGGWLLSLVQSQLSAFAGDVEHYLLLVTDYARLLDQFTERTALQVARGMRMPKVQVLQARALLKQLRAVCSQTLRVIPKGASSGFVQELDARILNHVQPAFDRAIAGLSEEYYRLAPATVGVSQYPGGATLYRELVRLNTTLDLTPEEVHARGQVRMAEIHKELSAIRTEAGGTVKQLDLRADTPAEVSALFEKYIQRIQPYIGQCFAAVPRAGCTAAPLPEALQSSMTFGYYDPPTPESQTGTFRFNASNLQGRGAWSIASLTYHELLPGHHLHMALQQESSTLHPLRRYGFINAYNEGWAEYAATLAGELGLYDYPGERRGRLMMEALFTCRLVVDTGMNALDWSLERAREYMHRHSAMSAEEVAMDSIRYSCDIPAQALAYKIGDAHLLALRARARERMGRRFNLKDFHTAVVGGGALPMADVEWHVEQVLGL